MKMLRLFGLDSSIVHTCSDGHWHLQQTVLFKCVARGSYTHCTENYSASAKALALWASTKCSVSFDTELSRNLHNIGEFCARSLIENKETPPMRPTMISLLLLASASASWAQNTQPPANRDANTPAVNSPNSPPNPGAPVAGANSFTEGQARSRIEDKGFKNVSGLKKDDSGVWRGKADHNGKAVNVSVDFQGNVVSQ